MHHLNSSIYLFIIFFYAYKYIRDGSNNCNCVTTVWNRTRATAYRCIFPTATASCTVTAPLRLWSLTNISVIVDFSKVKCGLRYCSATYSLCELWIFTEGWKLQKFLSLVAIWKYEEMSNLISIVEKFSVTCESFILGVKISSVNAST